MTQSGVDAKYGEMEGPVLVQRRGAVPRWVWWMSGVVLVLAVAVAAVVAYVIRNAEPILRRRVIATLEDRFHSPVELDALHISVLQGLQVSGNGLRILSITGPPDAGVRAADAAPMVSVDGFEFRTGLRQLFEPTMRVKTVRVEGMRLNIPPKQERGELFSREKPGPLKPKLSIVVDQMICSDVKLTIETDKPGKEPLVFNIRDVTLHDVGGKRPLEFEARLVNPKPVGDIHSTGHFGPWHADEPRDTQVDGEYSFTHADLGTIKGIAGTLSSTGTYSGTLGEIGVVGTTETPDFSLDVSEHPVDLRTEFNATVDGTSGDTKLNSVHATFLHTVLQVHGMVLRSGHVKGGGVESTPGHLIDISVVADQARIEDILRPGPVSVSKKMNIQGKFEIRGVTFSNAKWQGTVDKLSPRAQGHPQGKNDVGPAPVVASQMGGDFVLANAVVTVPKLNYQMPGANVDLGGTYSLDGETFDFNGKVRTEATASEMLTGWKKWVAMPFDPLFKKDGAGVEVPVTITGTKSEPKFGVDMGKLKAQILHRNKGQDQVEKPPPAHP